MLNLVSISTIHPSKQDRHVLNPSRLMIAYILWGAKVWLFDAVACVTTMYFGNSL
jgi:hypothetical protein